MKVLYNDWDLILADDFTANYFNKLQEFINEEYQNYKVYPPKDDIFTALKLTTFANTKVVIMGQDPYHEEGEAFGLAFAVKKGVKIPPSLRNIYNELRDDLNITTPTHGDLTSWAKQGVLMLNSILTVREHLPLSHKNKGWETLTDHIIQALNTADHPIVFILWGNNARNMKRLINNPQHLIIESAHPSPLSARRGFFGSKPFSRTDDFLRANNLEPINWEID